MSLQPLHSPSDQPVPNLIPVGFKSPLRCALVPQVSLLLNLERPQDAADYWEPGSPLQAQLTADEVS